MIFISIASMGTHENSLSISQFKSMQTMNNEEFELKLKNMSEEKVDLDSRTMLDPIPKKSLENYANIQLKKNYPGQYQHLEKRRRYYSGHFTFIENVLEFLKRKEKIDSVTELMADIETGVTLIKKLQKTNISCDPELNIVVGLTKFTLRLFIASAESYSTVHSDIIDKN
jgi:hypothetical protein